MGNRPYVAVRALRRLRSSTDLSIGARQLHRPSGGLSLRNLMNATPLRMREKTRRGNGHVERVAAITRPRNGTIYSQNESCWFGRDIERRAN